MVQQCRYGYWRINDMPSTFIHYVPQLVLVSRVLLSDASVYFVCVGVRPRAPVCVCVCSCQSIAYGTVLV